MTPGHTALLDVLYWPTVQLSVSIIIIRVPARFFSSRKTHTRPEELDSSLSLYRWLRVPVWKKWLPDAGPFLGGTRKRVNPYNRTDTARFLDELRRSEIAHWVQLGFLIPCWFWNPLWASILMTLYALLSNLPCVAAQRYNRVILRCRTTLLNQRNLAK